MFNFKVQELTCFLYLHFFRSTKTAKIFTQKFHQDLLLFMLILCFECTINILKFDKF